MKLSKTDISLLIGTFIEHFDVAIYGFLAPILGDLFFPQYAPTTKLILTYSVLASSLITKPIGIFIFGQIARQKHPARALYFSFIGIGILTASMGCLPTYTQVGIIAPILLFVFRILLGIFSAGEDCIGKLYLLENKSPQKRSIVSHLYQFGFIAAFVLASGLSIPILSQSQSNFYWRIPFWIGGLLAFLGIFLRAQLKKQILQPLETIYRTHILRVIWNEKKSIIRVASISSLSYLTYYIPFVFLNTFVPMVTNISLKKMMYINTGLLLFDMCLLPLLAYCFKSFDARRTMFISSLLISFMSMPIFYHLPQSTIIYVTTFRIIIVILGLIYLGPMNALLFNQFQKPDKYILVGLGESIGSSLLGKASPAICFFLFQFTHSTLGPAIFVASVGFIASLGVLYAK